MEPLNKRQFGDNSTALSRLERHDMNLIKPCIKIQLELEMPWTLVGGGGGGNLVIISPLAMYLAYSCTVCGHFKRQCIYMA